MALCQSCQLPEGLLQEPHPPRLGKPSSGPQSRVLPVTLLIWQLSTFALSHVSFPSFVCSPESCCLLCNRVCSSENLVQIDKSQFAFEMGQDPSLCKEFLFL